jgi:hypothetical protein
MQNHTTDHPNRFDTSFSIFASRVDPPDDGSAEQKDRQFEWQPSLFSFRSLLARSHSKSTDHYRKLM